MTWLAYEMVLDRSALARNIQSLERDGYLLQRPDGDDGRSRPCGTDPSRAAEAHRTSPSFTEANRLQRKAQNRFEKGYDEQHAAALRVALAEIYSDDFAAAFGQAWPTERGLFISLVGERQ